MKPGDVKYCQLFMSPEYSDFKWIGIIQGGRANCTRLNAHVAAFFIFDVPHIIPGREFNAASSAERPGKLKIRAEPVLCLKVFLTNARTY